MSDSNTVESPADDAIDTPPLRAKHLGLRLPVLPDVPEVVPARMINEVLYCERLFYLEWAQGEFDDNWYTVEGRAVHRRPDKPGGELPPPVQARINTPFRSRKGAAPLKPSRSEGCRLWCLRHSALERERLR